MEAADRTLLDRFIAGNDETAFRTLVGRHLDLVHAVARRVTGSDDHARDVSQATFIRLAQRAALVPADVSLPAWLHRTTRSLAVDLVRRETRRKKREAGMPPHDSMDSPPEPAWSALAPVVDELVDALPAADRELVLARYYRNEPHAVIAARLGVTEPLARKRASRALEKLRALLGRRGIATSSAALATLLPAHATPPASSSVALAVNSAVQGIVPAVPQAFSVHLAMTALQKSAVAAAAVVFLSSLGYAVRSSSPAALSSPSKTVSEPGDTTADASRTRPRRSTPATAAERLERLRQIIAITNPVERTRGFLDFMDVLAPDQYLETTGHLNELGVGESSNEFSLLLSGWTKADPHAAATWSRKNSREGFSHDVLITWGESDSEAAIDWVIRQFPTATGHDGRARQPLVVTLAGMAARDPKAAVKALAVIPDGNDRSEALRELASHMAGMQPDAIEILLAAAEEGPARSALVAWSLDSIVRSGRPERALELLLADEEAQKQLSVQSFFRMWQREDPAGAATHIEKLPEGSIRNEAVTGLCLESTNADPPKAFTLLRRYPGAATDVVVAQMAEECSIEHVALAVEQVLQMEDETLRNEVLTRRLGWWLQRHESAARKWLESHEIPAVVKEAIENPPENP